VKTLAIRGRGVLLLIGIVAWWAANLQPAHAAGVAYQKGDVLAAIGSGMIQHFDPNGNVIATLDTTTNAEMYGICFDAAGNLYTTDPYAQGMTIQQMSKFDSSGTLKQASWAGPFAGSPRDCLQAKDGSIWTIEDYPQASLQQWTTAGTLLASYSSPRVGGEWFDLNPDQCVFDITAGNAISRFNVCTNSYLPDLATNLPGGGCNAIRIRADGTILVACNEYVNLVDAAGTVLKSYPRADLPDSSGRLYALSLDPDGTSFWTGDFYYLGSIYRIDIATGNLITHFSSTVDVPNILGGLAVAGDLRVAADSAPPACTLTAVLPGPPKQVKITVQDPESGLQSIDVTKFVNATVDVPSFTPGTKGPVIVTGTKIDQSKGAQVGLRATDVAGSVTDCDPDLLTIKPGEVQRIRDVLSSENRLTLSNGSPGLVSLRVTVNRKTFELAHLRSNEVRVLDISSAMVAGSHNTITIRGYGRRGSSADLVVSE